MATPILSIVVVVVVIACLGLASPGDQKDAAWATSSRDDARASDAWRRPPPPRKHSAGERAHHHQMIPKQPYASQLYWEIFRCSHSRGGSTSHLPVISEDDYRKWVFKPFDPSPDYRRSETMDLTAEMAKLPKIKTRAQALQNSRSLPNPRHSQPKPQIARSNSERLACFDDRNHAPNRFGWTPDLPSMPGTPRLLVVPTSPLGGSFLTTNVRASFYSLPPPPSNGASQAMALSRQHAAAPKAKLPSRRKKPSTKPKYVPPVEKVSPQHVPPTTLLRDPRRYGVFASGQISR